MSKRKGLSKETKELYTSLGRSLFLSFIALFAIVTATVAWFASNTNVNSTSNEISASDDTQYILACVGERLESEEKHLLNIKQDEPQLWGETKLPLGNIEVYDSYIDSSTGEEISKTQSYYTYRGEFAWCLQKPINFYPGARGELEFYVIPKVSGLKSISLNLEIKAYNSQMDSEHTIGAVPQEDTILSDLLKGHILFFGSLDDNLGYGNWIKIDDTFVVSDSLNNALRVGKPYKVTLYWIWPKHYRNLIYDKYSTRGDIFGNTVDNADYQNLINYINNNGQYFFYKGASDSDYPNTSDNMSEEDFKKGNNYYDKADEYIGKNADFIYLSVFTE